MNWLKLKHNIIKICAVLIIEVASSTDCSHLIPSPYSFNLGQSVDFNSGVVPNAPVFYPLPLDSEQVAMPPAAVPNDDTSAGWTTKAFSCSLIPCLEEETSAAVCACNFNTGNVVTFKNTCDVKKHNCRFDTSFKVILEEICPWEFESRRSNTQLVVNYSDPKYYNK